MISASVNVQNVQAVIKDLKELDSGSVRELRASLRTNLGGVVSAIQASVPKTAPMKGMERGRNRGATKWRGINKPKVSFYPGRSKIGGNNLVVITVTGGKRGLGFDYAELAGVRSRPPKEMSKTYTRRTRGGGVSREMSHRVNGQGDIMIRKLQSVKPISGKAGRYAYDAFLKMRPAVIAIAEKTLDQYAARVNRKFGIK